MQQRKITLYASNVIERIENKFVADESHYILDVTVEPIDNKSCKLILAIKKPSFSNQAYQEVKELLEQMEEEKNEIIFGQVYDDEPYYGF